MEFLKELDHEHILKILEFDDSVPDTYYLVTELVEGGELFDRLTHKTVYNEKEARDLVRVLLDVLVRLEDHSIVHRDLKPENLLLKSTDRDDDIVLIDFGFAERCNGRSLTAQCGTPTYVAPEVLKKGPYGLEADMWSAGVICYILLGGKQL